jgi:MFS family permease
MSEERSGEKSLLLGESKTSAEDHGLGLFNNWINYRVHIPFHVPRIPHTEGATFWDNWFHHTLPVKDPSSIVPIPPFPVRAIVLVLLFLLVFGPSISYSSVGALYTQLKADMGFTDAQLGFLFSAYALPNIVAVFFAGVMVDNLGVNFCCLLFASFFMAGNLLALGETYGFLLAGRVLYGLGTECVSVVQDALLARWYSRDTQITLSLALAVCMLSFRLSSFVSMFAVPEVYAWWGFFAVLAITALFVAISFASATTLVVIDKKYEDYLHTPSAEVFSWSSILHLPPLFWALVVITFGIYSAVLPFISFSSEFLQQKWGMTDVEASQATSCLYLAAAVVMIPFGFALDRYGHRVTIISIACVIPLIAYSLLLFTPLSPFIGCLLLGVTHGLLPGAVFPSIALIIQPALVGTAYGLITSALNTALFISPLILGFIPDCMHEPAAQTHFAGVTAVMLVRIGVLMAFALLGCGGSVCAWLIDSRTGAILETTCVLKLGSKVSDNLLRQSQQIFDENQKQADLP